jgi:glycosyltransferase involved in cell wall biosynthesis
VLSFSIVTPSMNQVRFVERTLRSVLDQGYQPLEYVVCDGGSTDGSRAILTSYADRVNVVSEPDGGQAAAVNKGIRLTSGEVIGWLNSDDVYLPGALASVAAYFESNPAVDVVYGDGQLIDADDRVVGTYYTEPWHPARLAQRCFLCQPAVFLRRRVVERYGGLDERLHYCLDYEYWLRLAAAGARFAYVPTNLAAARLYPETKTMGAPLAVHHEINTMLRERLGRVPDSWLLNEAHTLVELRRSTGLRSDRLRELVPYGAEVVAMAARLSWRWNGSVPRSLLASALRPLADGAWNRVVQSRSTARSRPAS